MDGVSAAASIVGIATAGIQISIKVVTLANQIHTASERITAVGSDLSLTAAILHQLGDVMQPGQSTDVPILNQGGLQTTKASADTCEKIFREVEKETGKASEMIRKRKRPIGEKIKLSTVEKMKWPFLQPGLETLRTDLREAKGTLMLMLQVASLGISKRLIDQNQPSLPEKIEQTDVFRSILALQRQQRRLQKHNAGAVDPDGTAARDPVNMNTTARDPGNINPTSSSLTGISGASISSAKTHHSSQDQSEDETMFQSTANNDRPTSPDEIPNEASSQATVTNTNPKEFHLWSLYPAMKSDDRSLRVHWYSLDMGIGQEEIQDMIVENKAQGLPSFFSTLEKLNASERALATLVLHDIQVQNPRNHLTFISLKRTEQKLQHGDIIIEHVPTFNFIVQLQDINQRTTKEIPGDDVVLGERVIDTLRTAGNSREATRRMTKKATKSKEKGSNVEQTMELSRPTYIKVHKKYLDRETLDAYELPWEWDTQTPGYIIIKRWIPEQHQNIIFEHSRALRERKSRKKPPAVIESAFEYASVELKKDEGKFLFERERIPHEHGLGAYSKENEYIQRAETVRQEWADDAGDEDLAQERPEEAGEEDDDGSAESSDEPRDETDEVAAVDKLLRQYTTVFEGREEH